MHCKKMKFSIKDFFSKCDQPRICSHLRKKPLMENFIFVQWYERKRVFSDPYLRIKNNPQKKPVVGKFSAVWRKCLVQKWWKDLWKHTKKGKIINKMPNETCFELYKLQSIFLSYGLIERYLHNTVQVG